MACPVLAAVLAPAAFAGGTDTVVSTVKTEGKNSKPVRGATVFLGVTPVEGKFEARLACTNCKGRVASRGVTRDATLIFATGTSTGAGCANPSFLFGKRPLASAFYKRHQGMRTFD